MPQPYVLELDGILAGRLFNVSGGGIRQVAVATGGSLRDSSVGTVTYGDMTLTSGVGMSQAYYKWIAETFNQNATRRSGAVIAIQQSKQIARRDFYNALITEVTLPALDASSKDAAYMTVKIVPERIRYTKPEEQKDLKVYASEGDKLWQCCNFQIEIDGLDTACRHVTKIEGLSLKQSVKELSAGAHRTSGYVPGPVKLGDLKVTLPQAYARGFIDWLDNSVIQGKAAHGTGKNGRIVFMASNLSTSYFEVSLMGLQIFEVKMASASTQGTTPVTVTMSCRDMKFSAGGASVK